MAEREVDLAVAGGGCHDGEPVRRDRPLRWRAAVERGEPVRRDRPLRWRAAVERGVLVGVDLRVLLGSRRLASQISRSVNLAVEPERGRVAMVSCGRTGGSASRASWAVG